MLWPHEGPRVHLMMMMGRGDFDPGIAAIHQCAEFVVCASDRVRARMLVCVSVSVCVCVYLKFFGALFEHML